jgi:hypothetical protein
MTPPWKVMTYDRRVVGTHEDRDLHVAHDEPCKEVEEVAEPTTFQNISVEKTSPISNMVICLKFGDIIFAKII